MEPISMKPTIYISAKELPEIRDWKLDEEYMVMVKVKMKSISAYERSVNASLEIESVKVCDDSKKEVNDMDEDELNEYAAKARKGMA